MLFKLTMSQIAPGFNKVLSSIFWWMGGSNIYKVIHYVLIQKYLQMGKNYFNYHVTESRKLSIKLTYTDSTVKNH